MRGKKFLFLIIKIAIGLGSLLLIWWRLRNDLTTEKLFLLSEAVFSFKGLWLAIGSILLIPVNWGIEAYKWMKITAPIENISYNKATRSVYSGVCLGNLAPGRATEFVAKILFFQPENRPQVTLLHFVNGLIQLSVTILSGIMALVFIIGQTFQGEQWLPILATTLGVVCLLVLVLVVLNINRIMNWVNQRFNKLNTGEVITYTLPIQLFLELFFLSIIRYAVFSTQFLLVLKLFTNHSIDLPSLAAMFLYFFFTTIIPMFSVIEAAVRAAVALAVFNGLGMSETSLALASVSIWMVNIILPSIVGYIFLVKEKFNFKNSFNALKP